MSERVWFFAAMSGVMALAAAIYWLGFRHGERYAVDRLCEFKAVRIIAEDMCR